MIIKGFDNIKKFNQENNIGKFETTELQLELGQAVYGYFIGNIKKILQSKDGNKYSQNIIIIASFEDKKNYRIYSTFDLDDKIALIKMNQYIGICRFKDTEKGYKNLVLLTHTSEAILKGHDNSTDIVAENKVDDLPEGLR